MQITSIHADYTHGNQICLVTNPEVTEEIIDEIHRSFPGTERRFGEHYGKFMISGEDPYLLPESFLADMEELLNKAEYAVQEEKNRKQDEHNRLLDHLNKLFDLPVA